MRGGGKRAYTEADVVTFCTIPLHAFRIEQENLCVRGMNLKRIYINIFTLNAPAFNSVRENTKNDPRALLP